MSVAPTGQRAAIPEASTAGARPESSGQGHRVRARRTALPQVARNASDDEILGIDTGPGAQSDSTGESESAAATNASGATGADDTLRECAESSNDAQLNPQAQAAPDSIPELRRAWQDAQSYRESFATPEEARAATALLGDLDRMDALFFSNRPEDHAELARAVANLDPTAFASLAKAMNTLATDDANTPPQAAPTTAAQQDRSTPNRPVSPAGPSTPTQAQAEFVHAANAAAVQGVLDAIETQVERLLPEGASKTARNRVVGEIYRELDASLASNRQLGQQMRDALRSGNLDAAHQRAIVALVTGRARQALPGIAKRVLNEWTSTVVAANQDRLARQRAAAHRVDITGSGRGGDGGRRSLGPRDIDYARMSDSDILNL